MLLIWDFEVDHILSWRAIAQALIVLSDTCPEVPLLDVKKLFVEYNCSKFPQMSGIFFDWHNDEGKEDENSQGEGKVFDCVHFNLLKIMFKVFIYRLKF